MFVAREEWYSTRKSRVQIRHFVVLVFDSVLILFLEKNLILIKSYVHIDTSKTDLSTKI